MARKFQNGFKYSILIVLILLYMGSVNGQDTTSSIVKGKIRVKLMPEVASTMNVKKSTFRNSPITGIKNIDNLNSSYGVTEMTRVFPYSPKYEERHKKYGLDLWYEITISDRQGTLEAADGYKKLPEIQVAEPIYSVKVVEGTGGPVYVSPPASPGSRSDIEPFNDPYLPKQWHYNNTGQTGGTAGEDINLFDAWKKTVGNPKVIVSIHDLGVQVNHEDLMNMMWVNTAELNGQAGVDDDGNGYIDDINGFNFSNNTGTVDAAFHGTHVAGTIAAENNNGIGVAGIAGGSGKGDGVRIMTCQILGGTHAADVAQSYIYAADNGAVISQNSWGYNDPGAYEQATLDAIDYFIAEAGNFPGSLMKGGVVIFAAGNSSIEDLSYPGAYPSCIAVSALDALGTKPPYSNYGTWVDISAPGGDTDDDISLGTSNKYSNGVLSTLDHNGYGYLDGTSMACPHVSGVAALIISKFGSSTFTNKDLKTHLLTGVRNIYNIPGNSDYIGKLGSGELDAEMGLATDNKQAPDRISNLSLTGISQDFATFSWTVPADVDDGIPVLFELVYSKEPINSSTLFSAKIISVPNTSPAGTVINQEITNLQAVTQYYFAARSKDRWGNISELSNSISSSTNSGPTASLDPTKTRLSVNINVTARTTGKDSILLSNNGEGILRWEGNTRHVAAVPLSVKPDLRYPVLSDGNSSPTGIISSQVYPVAFNNIQKDTLSEKSYVTPWESLMVFGETNIQVPNSSATRFVVDEENGFNLTHVDVYLNHDSKTGPVILEVYKGPDINDAQLLLAQEVPVTAANNYSYIKLDEQIFLEKGSSFWIVFHVPAGNKFPLGGALELDKEDSKNCYISLNGGSSWRLFEDLYYDNRVVWALYAISSQVNLNHFVTLSPASGSLNHNKSAWISASVDGTNMINGQYDDYLDINTNETGKPLLRVPVSVKISGHKPVISPVKRVDFGSILMGNSAQVHVSIKNTGLGRFLFKSQAVSLSNSQFEMLPASLDKIESGEQTDLVFSFKPGSLGNQYSHVTLNEVNGNNYTFDLFGVGIEPPVAKINPAKITLNNLAIGDTINASFYLSNQGKFPLDYYMPSFADGSNMQYVPDDIHKFGYTTIVDSVGSTYTWNDIKSTGTEITNGFSGNDMTNIYQKFPLNFLFPFFGKNENFIYISKYGVLSFNNNNSIWSMSPMSYKSTVNPDRYISAFGFPILFQEAGFGKIYYKRESDKFIVQYDDVPEWNGEGYDYATETFVKASMTFQVVLSDNGNISMYFKECSLPPLDKAVDLVAIEDQSRKDGIIINGMTWGKDYKVTHGFSFKPGSAVHFINPGLGLFTDLNYPSGTVMPNDSLLIKYRINTDSLNLLPYTENLVIVTNDPVHNPTIHSIDFTINSGGGSLIKTDLSSIDFDTVYVASNTSGTLLVSNTGRATDQVLTAVFDNNNFTFVGALPELIKPERTLSYSIRLKTVSAGVFTDTLRITTLNGALLKVGLKGTVVQGPTINVLNSGDANLASITKLNVPAGTNAAAVTMKVKNTGAKPLEVSPANTDWTLVSEKIASPSAGVSYNWKSSKNPGGPGYEWIELADTISKIDEGLDSYNNKEWSQGIKIPFTFPFYGNSYDTVYVGISGLVTFTKGQDDAGYFWGGDVIPAQGQPNNYIAPLFLFGGPDMIDLYPKSGVYYILQNDRVIVEYRDYNSNFSMGNPISFELILFKNGNIKFQYKMPESGPNFITDKGVIGIENADGTQGVQVSLNQNYVNSDMAIGLYPMNKKRVMPGEVKEFNVVLSAKDLFAGSYSDSLIIYNNDPVSLEKKIPVKIVVTGVPQVKLPDSLDFGDILLKPEGDTLTREFELRNSGTANFSVSSTSLTLPGTFNMEAYLETGGTWNWTKLDSYPAVFPRTIPPHASLKMRVSVSPSLPAMPRDTFKLTTDAGKFSVPMKATIYYPPVVKLTDQDMKDADTLFVYAPSNSFFETKTIILKNNNADKPGGYHLNYELSVAYLRDTVAETYSVPASVLSSGSDGRILYEYNPSLNGVIKAVKASKPSIKPLSESYNRILANDSASEAATTLGYGGSMAFYSATAFDAPADGFNLSHVQTWYTPGDWLNSKIIVRVYGGNNDLNSAKLLFSETFTVNSPAADQTGSLLTFQLSEELSFFPNERFFVVFGYDAGALHPQGSVKVPKVEDGRFLFGAGDQWYDITTQGTLSSYGWMVRACEQRAKSTLWVALDSPTSGQLEPGSSTDLKLNFDASPAGKGENVAKLHIHSNDISTPERELVLILRKNNGPEFEVNPLVINTVENDTIRFDVTASDLEGDDFTLEPDSAYPLLKTDTGKKVSMLTGIPGIVPLTKTISLVYTPDFNSQGRRIFYVKGTDTNGNVTKMKILFNVTNVNRPPVPITRDILVLDGNLNYFMVKPSYVFLDPDLNDVLTMDAVIDDPSVAAMYSSGNSYILAPLANGTTSIRFNVSDPYGASATNLLQVQTINVISDARDLKEDALNIYPNPTINGLIKMKFPSYLSGSILITVTNNVGETVMNKKTTITGNEEFDMNLSGLIPGIYLIKINNNDHVYIDKIIKM